MPFLIANPWGLLALLGIPIILLIHFLQRQAKVIPCSTLFLLKQTQKESASGRKFDTLMHSIPLWMQLLMVLLLTLLLIEPRFVNSQATQRIAIVLDSSASMSVFKEQVKQAVIEEIPKAQGVAPNRELWVLDSDLSKDRIYHGNSLEELKVKLEAWAPQSGTSSPQHALRIARSLAGHDGSLIYFTDTPQTTSTYNTAVHAIGEARENVGFTGVTFDASADSLIWKASIRNYSNTPASRSWQVHYANNTLSEIQEISLKPGELKLIKGIFPEEIERAEIRLSADEFTYDDISPLVPPLPKMLNVLTDTKEKFHLFAEKITNNFPNVHSASSSQPADFSIKSHSTTVKKFGPKPGIILLDSTLDYTDYKVQSLLAADHVLTEGLNWQQLIISEEPRFTLTKNDTPLIWAGKQPIIFLREVPVGLGRSFEQLVFNFDLQRSNALKQESVALLIYRYIEELRSKKSAPIKSITELSQPLALNIDPKGKQVMMEHFDVNGTLLDQQAFSPKIQLRSPNAVHFYTISQGETLLMEGASYFADTREADLSNCGSGILKAAIAGQAKDQHTLDDRMWRLWTILILVALLLSWMYGKQPTNH